MQQAITSAGKCQFCHKTYSKSTISRHLHNHLQEKSLHNKLGKSFLLKIETKPRWGKTPYFLLIWIDGGTTMEELDELLRNTWLECCGHMSSFTVPSNKRTTGFDFSIFDAYELLDKGKINKYEEIMEQVNGEVPMSKTTGKIMYKDLKIDYTYDYGSSTELQLTVVQEYNVKADESIVLLSRNEDPNLLCEKCGKLPATELCTVCYSYGNKSLFCSSCAKKHAKSCEDFNDYAALPVVNSPRMGVCGYTGEN